MSKKIALIFVDGKPSRKTTSSSELPTQATLPRVLYARINADTHRANPPQSLFVPPHPDDLVSIYGNCSLLCMMQEVGQCCAVNGMAEHHLTDGQPNTSSKRELHHTPLCVESGYCGTTARQASYNSSRGLHNVQIARSNGTFLSHGMDSKTGSTTIPGANIVSCFVNPSN